MPVTFEELIAKYADYRRSCGMKERPMLDLHYFFNACKKKFGGCSCLNQDMVDWWWEQRNSEAAVTHRSRVNKVLPFLKYAIIHGLAQLNIPKTPPYVESNTPPHFFTKAELGNFFRACDEIATVRPWSRS